METAAPTAPLAASVRSRYQSLQAGASPSRGPGAPLSPAPLHPPDSSSTSKKRPRRARGRASSLAWLAAPSAPRGPLRPRLRFSLGYSPLREELTLTGLGAWELPRGPLPGRGTYVRLRLVPGGAGRRQTAPQPPGPSAAFPESFCFRGCSPRALRAQSLRMAVYSRDFPGLGSSFVGEVVFPCARVVSDSVSGCLVSYTRELSASKSKRPKSLSCQNLLAPGPQAPRMGSQGRLFLLLQFQAVAGRIKVLVLRAENLHSLGRLPGHRAHSVVIGLYQAGQLLDSRETRAVVGCSPVWNAPFLFSLPPGDLQEQNLFLQFTVRQSRLLSRTVTLGWVRIGPEASAAGRAHWQDMCRRSLRESSQWHPLCPGKPDPPGAAASGTGTRNS
ncbi:synaptotagmin-4-like [Antechinus flavipes]|uniref:synaptotagmin-4-like n=1 Tax=Antechinus flavipes TaxID=38775 RepID=UPI00223590F9|nr:synaptotagmin-4-like [Antechinus flavipes]